MNIQAKIVADSVNPKGQRITTFLCVYPRIVHAEVMTHRMFSRNAASSRAIPYRKMMEQIQNEPFIPIAWQKDHKGMQGTEYLTDEEDIRQARLGWLGARDKAIQHSMDLSINVGATKQICNRLLEPFQWYTCLITATEWDNFFELRCPQYTFHTDKDEKDFIFKSRKDALTYFGEDETVEYAEGIDYPLGKLSDFQWLNANQSAAEIHIQALAEAIWDARNESEPKELKEGEWHIPYGDDIDMDMLATNYGEDVAYDMALKVAVVRCARTSYTVIGSEDKHNYEADIKLFNRLYSMRHASPFEHVAKCMTEEEYTAFLKCTDADIDTREVSNPDSYLLPRNNFEASNIRAERGWCDNFRGFIPYRRILNL